jgi:hypothetical protein
MAPAAGGRPQRRLDGIGEPLLVAGNRFDVDQLCRKCDYVRGAVDHAVSLEATLASQSLDHLAAR